MNASRIFPSSMLFALLLATAIPAVAAFPAAAESAERTAMHQTAGAETAALARNEAAPGTLGEWNDIIESSLFLLFRRTELYRGGMRVLVVDNPSVLVKLYPDGTFVLSTGLLDYIDESLFESASSSTRRMRTFDSEREARLIPFLAIEAAHFALDHQIAAFRRNRALGTGAGSDPFRYDTGEALEADRFSPILISLAGFDPLLLDVWLSSLADIYETAPANTAFAGYLAALPSPAVRQASLADSRETMPKITAEFADILSDLRSGLALNEASDSLAALAETWPSSTWLDRLAATVFHKRWLATVPASVQRVKTFFPVAAEDDPATPAFLSLFDENPPEFPAAGAFAQSGERTVTGSLIPGGGIPGDARLYASAREAYQKAADSSLASGYASAHAMLLAWSDQATAIRMAEGAAAEEAGSGDSTARANYASLLYLTGTDYAKAQYLLDTLPGTRRKSDLDRGIPGDERDLVLNSALMLRSLGDLARSLEKKKHFERLYAPTASRGTIPFRQVAVGDTADTLAARWGRPAEIFYNYVTENWHYSSLSASVQLGRDAAVPGVQVIRRIRFGSGSPLSPGNDVRAGDKRTDFEAVFGKPVYRSGDSEVYLKDGNRISVIYLADTIRSVTAGL